MFRGFINEIGVIETADDEGLVIRSAKAAAELEIGGSVGIAGVCLSAEEIHEDWFRVALSAETRERSRLGELAREERVNVELPLRAGDKLEGHLVQGHVDAVAKVLRIDAEPGGRRHLYRRCAGRDA